MKGNNVMNESQNRNYQQKCPQPTPPTPAPCPSPCPPTCPCEAILSIVSSIAHGEEALACIMEVECAKVNKVLCSYNDYETLIAVNTSVQNTLEQIRGIEEVLKAKLDSIIPFLNNCL